MIERERLQELINQGATIYEAKYDKVNPVSLKNKIRFVSERYPVIVFEPRPNEKYKHHKYFDKLYETQAAAEWVAKMHANRIETFEPKIYENLDEWDTYHFTEPKLKCRGSLSVTPNTIIVVSGYKGYCETHKSFGDRTKDNYIKACEYARNLFLGKENENETDSDR